MARTALLFVAFSLISLTLPFEVRAVSPPPDGGYANFNTAEGTDALLSLTTGVGNTALGWYALHNDTSGGSNTATGYNALYFNTGSFNTAEGRGALYRNTIGNDNTALGYAALKGNTIGSANTAVGWEALEVNLGASANTGLGYQALFSNTSGYSNTATGYQTLYFNNSGYQNTADGLGALSLNTTGSNNIAIGFSAGGSLTTGSNNIEVGNLGLNGEADTIRIGTEGAQTATYMAGISGATVAGGIGVIVDINGHLGTSTSSARYKENIQPMDKASEAILLLQPVTFRYKKTLDPNAIPQFGLVAEQVEKVDPDLVARDNQGKPYSVRYDAVNAMLLNEFLKAHHRVEALEKDLARQEKETQATIARLESALQTQATQLQQVTQQLESHREKVQLASDN